MGRRSGRRENIGLGLHPLAPRGTVMRPVCHRLQLGEFVRGSAVPFDDSARHCAGVFGYHGLMSDGPQ
jgi:hypothetical protein